MGRFFNHMQRQNTFDIKLTMTLNGNKCYLQHYIYFFLKLWNHFEAAMWLKGPISSDIDRSNID